MVLTADCPLVDTHNYYDVKQNNYYWQCKTSRDYDVATVKNNKGLVGAIRFFFIFDKNNKYLLKIFQHHKLLFRRYLS